jgi:hypothetical protein
VGSARSIVEHYLIILAIAPIPCSAARVRLRLATVAIRTVVGATGARSLFVRVCTCLILFLCTFCARHVHKKLHHSVETVFAVLFVSAAKGADSPLTPSRLVHDPRHGGTVQGAARSHSHSGAQGGARSAGGATIYAPTVVVMFTILKVAVVWAFLLVRMCVCACL